MKVGMIAYEQSDFLDERDRFDEPGDEVSQELYAEVENAADLIEAVNEFVELSGIDVPRGYVIGLVKI